MPAVSTAVAGIANRAAAIGGAGRAAAGAASAGRAAAGVAAGAAAGAAAGRMATATSNTGNRTVLGIPIPFAGNAGRRIGKGFSAVGAAESTISKGYALLSPMNTMTGLIGLPVLRSAAEWKWMQRIPKAAGFLGGTAAAIEAPSNFLASSNVAGTVHAASSTLDGITNITGIDMGGAAAAVRGVEERAGQVIGSVFRSATSATGAALGKVEGTWLKGGTAQAILEGRAEAAQARRSRIASAHAERLNSPPSFRNSALDETARKLAAASPEEAREIMAGVGETLGKGGSIGDKIARFRDKRDLAKYGQKVFGGEAAIARAEQREAFWKDPVGNIRGRIENAPDAIGQMNAAQALNTALIVGNYAVNAYKTISTARGSIGHLKEMATQLTGQKMGTFKLLFGRNLPPEIKALRSHIWKSVLPQALLSLGGSVLTHKYGYRNGQFNYGAFTALSMGTQAAHGLLGAISSSAAFDAHKALTEMQAEGQPLDAQATLDFLVAFSPAFKKLAASNPEQAKLVGYGYQLGGVGLAQLMKDAASGEAAFLQRSQQGQELYQQLAAAQAAPAAPQHQPEAARVQGIHTAREMERRGGMADRAATHAGRYLAEGTGGQRGMVPSPA